MRIRMSSLIWWMQQTLSVTLYLTTQLIETGVPVVIALNMADLVAKRGIKIDVKRLSMLLGCPIIETSALKQTGLDRSD